MKLYLHRIKFRFFVALLFVHLLPSISKAGGTLFYQPLNRDRSVNAFEWEQIWREAYRRDYNQIVVQWTAYGEQLFDQDNWLLNSLEIANQAGLDLIIGLYADPSFSQTILQAGWEDRFEEYWISLQRRSLSYQQSLLPVLKQRNISVKGWYFPPELSDRLFTTGERRRFTRQQLILMAEHLNHPLHISAYNLGYLSPQANANWLSSLQQLGLHVWWQDGSGANDLPAPTLEVYHNELPCAVSVVREAFVKISGTDEPFAAKHSPPRNYDSCHSNAIFSLRYMPWVQSISTLGTQ